jgi:predicted DNA-binding WGR domain protein
MVAIDGNRNVRRSYWICRSQDLFGWQIVVWAWRRLGSEPERRIRAFPDEQAAIAFSRHLLGRRSSAHRLIGVAYRLTP